MIKLSQSSANHQASRVSARTAMVVLFAFMLNLIGINGALAGLPGLFLTGSTGGVQTHQSGSKAQSRHLNVKPCHHNMASYGHRIPTSHTGTGIGSGSNNGLCCTDDDRSDKMPTALRTKRDREWQAKIDEPSKAPLHSIGSIDTSASFDIEIFQLHTAQIAGMLGAQAHFLRTVRLLT